jgi:hypothetical protein
MGDAKQKNTFLFDNNFRHFGFAKRIFAALKQCAGSVAGA